MMNFALKMMNYQEPASPPHHLPLKMKVKAYYYYYIIVIIIVIVCQLRCAVVCIEDVRERVRRWSPAQAQEISQNPPLKSRCGENCLRNSSGHDDSY